MNSNKMLVQNEVESMSHFTLMTARKQLVFERAAEEEVRSTFSGFHLSPKPERRPDPSPLIN